MSSDAFSFDNAAPAEAVDTSNMESNESSGMHSSPDGSYSNVTSTHRSETERRSRPQIEDAERPSRTAGRIGASPKRAARSTSSQRTERRRSTIKVHEKSRSSGGSPGGRKSPPNADEDLDKLIAEMQSQGEQLQAQVLRLEDKRSAELSMFGIKMQSIRDECTEFDQQYNHVLSCWRIAEEKSNMYEMELRTEVVMFHEVRQCLGEMQQHIGSVMQEDYGAGLRIQELEATITNLRSQYQVSTIAISQETQEELSEMRYRADKIIAEAHEAIAAKDVQQFHEKELITDEAMKLKQRNDILVSELNQSQHDAIQTFQYAHGEQRSLDISRVRLAEEEVAVRNLRGELSVSESMFNLEKHKIEKLHDEMDDHRQRYEQRLSLVMSNPNVHGQSMNTVDVASKVEIQRLKHELAVAQSTLAVPTQQMNVSRSGDEMLEARLVALQNEHNEMKEKASFKFWSNKVNEIRDGTNEAIDEMIKERIAANNERRMRMKNVMLEGLMKKMPD